MPLWQRRGGGMATAYWPTMPVSPSACRMVVPELEVNETTPGAGLHQQAR